MNRVEHIIHHLTPSNNNIISNSTSASGSTQKYRYTVNSNNLLTKQQRDFYEENGYILIKNLIPANELEIYRQRFIDIADGKVARAPTMTAMKDIALADKRQMGEQNFTKLQDWQDDPVLFSYCKHPLITKYVESVIGPSFKSIHTMLINKPKDIGMGSSRHPAHQDLWYFPIRPCDKICATWTAMQHIDQKNGCLYVQPGSHKQGELYKHTYPNDGIVNKAYHGIHTLTEKDSEEMLHVEMEIGDTLFFHPLLIHGSGRNNSDGYRKAISTHYAASDCYYIDVHGTVQEEIAEEVEELTVRKIGQGTKIDYIDFWKLKARQIQGKEFDQGLGLDTQIRQKYKTLLSGYMK